jgi:dienelactone hydrolase
MVVLNEPLEYRDGEALCEGYVAFDTSTHARRPCVLIAHAWDGPNEHIRAKASDLARMGHFGFVLDVYGKGVRGGATDDNTGLMAPYIGDRALLGRRLEAAVAAAKRHPFVDPDRLAVIGYCFGGLCALDLARRAPPGLRAAVSFHGMLHAPEAGPAEAITAKVLVLHGWRDPLSPPDDLLALARELTEAGADWQMIAYGRAAHAFTNPAAHNHRGGISYDEVTDHRSWTAMCSFLEESLGRSVTAAYR